MARRESPGSISTALAALQEAIKYDNACGHGDDEADDTDVAKHASNDRDVVFRQVQAVVLVAAGTKYFPGLYHLGGEAVAMHRVILTATRLDELGTDT